MLLIALYSVTIKQFIFSRRWSKTTNKPNRSRQLADKTNSSNNIILVLLLHRHKDRHWHEQEYTCKLGKKLYLPRYLNPALAWEARGEAQELQNIKMPWHWPENLRLDIHRVGDFILLHSMQRMSLLHYTFNKHIVFIPLYWKMLNSPGNKVHSSCSGVFLRATLTILLSRKCQLVLKYTIYRAGNFKLVG